MSDEQTVKCPCCGAQVSGEQLVKVDGPAPPWEECRVEDPRFSAVFCRVVPHVVVGCLLCAGGPASATPN